ncbi:hypothetical protein [Ammoniphilus sp. YIM 78166]|uniref:hypothetical protein n=1 Tax=Ammoniphilus sp. YIM 78166 TaxID=1644106 RepID=UPI00107008B7|nr:hypothetical protein [Ammoniphilus sp. YIM 78166]
MRNNGMMSWMVGIGAVALAVVGWMVPKRRKSPMQKAMKWTRNNVNWLGAVVVPVSRMVMRKMKVR